METQVKYVSEAKTKDEQTINHPLQLPLLLGGKYQHTSNWGIRPFVVWPQLPSLVLFCTISSPILSALLTLNYFYFSHLPCIYYTFCTHMHLILELLRAAFLDSVPPLHPRPPYICSVVVLCVSPSDLLSAFVAISPTPPGWSADGTETIYILSCTFV